MSFLLRPTSYIEGIGAQRSNTLAQAGIETIAEMFAAQASNIDSLLNNASSQQVRSWFCAGMLFRIDGLTPDIAEAFVDDEIRSVPAVAEAGLSTLERAIEKAEQANKLNHPPSLYKLAEFQREAWRARQRGMIAGRVIAANGSPVTNALVEVGGYDCVTDPKGRYAFDSIPEGTAKIRISLQDIAYQLEKTVEVKAAKMSGLLTTQLADLSAVPAPQILDELNGDLIAPSPNYRNRLRTLALSEFAEGTHFLVRTIDAGKSAKLLSLYKKRIGSDTFIDRTKVDISEIPAGTSEKQILQLQSGALVATSLSANDVADLKYQLWEQKNPIQTYTATPGGQ